ncbi:MAG: hypothetical protein IKN55_04805 [Oscillospiraceae bacterium]|nr:hypothetical protein [Oscillospiraceae bacterium]
MHRNSLLGASPAASFLYNLTKNLTAHLHHQLCAVLPKKSAGGILLILKKPLISRWQCGIIALYLSGGRICLPAQHQTRTERTTCHE